MLVLCCFESIGKAPNNRAHIEKRRFVPYPVGYTESGYFWYNFAAPNLPQFANFRQIS